MTNKLSKAIRRAWGWLLCRPSAESPTDADSEAEPKSADQESTLQKTLSKFPSILRVPRTRAMNPGPNLVIPNDEHHPEKRDTLHPASPTVWRTSGAPVLPRTVVVFGSTGVGKSSVINMLPNVDDGDPPAKVESSTRGVTSAPHVYHKVIDNEAYRVIDTIGTGESEGGTASTADAIESFYKTLLRQATGINLIVFVLRSGRITKMEENNYKLIELVCGGRIPVVLVVTGVENETDMDGWWNRHGRDRFKKLAGHACVVSTKGRGDGLVDLYNDSKPKISQLISKHADPTGYKVQPIQWMDWLIGEVRLLMRKSRDELHDTLYTLLCECGIPEKRAKRMAGAVNVPVRSSPSLVGLRVNEQEEGM